MAIRDIGNKAICLDCICVVSNQGNVGNLHSSPDHFMALGTSVVHTRNDDDDDDVIILPVLLLI